MGRHCRRGCGDAVCTWVWTRCGRSEPFLSTTRRVPSNGGSAAVVKNAAQTGPGPGNRHSAAELRTTSPEFKAPHLYPALDGLDGLTLHILCQDLFERFRCRVGWLRASGAGRRGGGDHRRGEGAKQLPGEVTFVIGACPSNRARFPPRLCQCNYAAIRL